MSAISIVAIPAEIYAFGWQYVLIIPTVGLIILIVNYLFLPVFYQNNIDNCYAVSVPIDSFQIEREKLNFSENAEWVSEALFPRLSVPKCKTEVACKQSFSSWSPKLDKFDCDLIIINLI